MTARALASLLLVPCCLLAQLRLFLLEGQAERLVVGSHDLGAVETGEAREAAFRIRNAGLAEVRLEGLSVAGTGFALSRAPWIPALVEPGSLLDFAVRFEPAAAGSYSATLSLNSQTVLLRAAALPAAVVSLERGGEYRVLASGTAIDFGSVERDSAVARRFRLDNPTPSPLSVTVAVTGAFFRGPAGLDSPVSLAPEEGAAFEVFFEPRAAGAHEGALEINRRTFRLRGTGVDPPFPQPQIFFDPPEAASGRTVRLMIRLASPSRVDGRGELQIEFQPALPELPNDPAIVFLDVRSRSAPFSVLRGEDIARFGPRQDVWFQTGTTAGRILVTAYLGDQREQAALTVGPLPVVIDSLKAARGASSLEVSLTGFDNTRSISQIVFSFCDQAGQLLAPGRLTLEAAGEFRRYFETSALGGVFSLRAGFPVTGDVTAVSELEVEISNSAGVTRSGRVPIRP